MTLVGWSMKEKEFKQNVEKYLKKLDATQRNSFAPLDALIQNALEGLNLNVMAVKHKDNLKSKDFNHILGLVIFN